jgi:hypothetical protein
MHCMQTASDVHTSLVSGIHLTVARLFTANSAKQLCDSSVCNSTFVYTRYEALVAAVQ